MIPWILHSSLTPWSQLTKPLSMSVKNSLTASPWQNRTLPPGSWPVVPSAVWVCKDSRGSRLSETREICRWMLWVLQFSLSFCLVKKSLGVCYLCGYFLNFSFWGCKRHLNRHRNQKCTYWTKEAKWFFIDKILKSLLQCGHRWGRLRWIQKLSGQNHLTFNTENF